MTNEEFEKAAASFDLSPKSAWYYALGIAGEAGEAAELVKKAARSNTTVDRDKLKLELGDVLWYVTRQANAHGFSLSDLMDANVAKLTDRRSRGVITG